MKIISIVVSALMLFSIISLAKSFWRGETLTAIQVEKKWSKQELNVSLFKNGDYGVRAQMAAALLKQQSQFYGLNLSEVREKFGMPDGFYFTDIYPAYIIQMKPKDVWQIVFLLDKKNLVNEIIVHKNCCE